MPSELDLRALDEEPPTPSRVDVERAIADGRRRRTRRGVGYAGAATLTVAAVVGASMVVGGLSTDDRPNADATDTTDTTAAAGTPKAAYTIPGIADWQPPAATPPTTCTLEQLPVPDNEPMALTSGADPSGRYIVGRTYPEGGGYRSVIWQDGQATAVDLPGDVEELLVDVNSAGTAVGWSYPDDASTESDPIPYVYSGGQVTPLPGVPTGNAEAINDAGAIAGTAEDVPLVWPSATAEPIRLPLPDGAKKAKVMGLDEDGTVVGVVGDATPYVWLADGTHHALPMPDLGGEPADSGMVFTVRNGWAIGWVSTEDSPNASGISPAAGDGDQPRAVRWNIGTGEVSVHDDTLNGPVAGVNAHGWMVGVSKERRAVLVTDAGTVALPELAPHDPGLLTNIPSWVSDDGSLITGQSDDATDTIQPVVWRCE